MSTETTATPQEQSKTDLTAGLSRLSEDTVFNDNLPKTEEKPKETATEETKKLEGDTTPSAEETAKTVELEALKTEAKTLGLPETATKEEIEAAKTKTEVKEEGFADNSENQLAAEEGTWKAYIESKNLEIPADFSEDKGLELYEKALEKQWEEKLAATQEIQIERLFEAVPEEKRAEAKLIFDLMAQGATLEQINAPIQSIRELKSLEPEALIRKSLSGLDGWDDKMVDSEIEKLTEKGLIDTEYKKLILYLDNQEQGINAQRQQQIEIYNTRQSQIKEQRRQQEINSFKATLDRMPTFMDRKLSDDNKRTILNEFSSGAAEKLLKNPEKVAKFMLWEKYGEQGLKYLESRAIEKATLAKMQTQHNVPSNIVANGGNQNRTNTTDNYKDGLERLEKDPQFRPA